MSEVTEYFLRHYTLVIDNDQASYWPAVAAAKQVLLDSGVTFGEYESMSRRERADRFASDIGDKIIDLIIDWWADVPTGGVGWQLAAEVMILADSELEWALGDHYMPETGDAEDYLPGDEDSE